MISWCWMRCVCYTNYNECSTFGIVMLSAILYSERLYNNETNQYLVPHIDMPFTCLWINLCCLGYLLYNSVTWHPKCLITGNSTVCLTVCSGSQQKNFKAHYYWSFASEIYWSPSAHLQYIPDDYLCSLFAVFLVKVNSPYSPGFCKIATEPVIQPWIIFVNESDEST